MATPHRPCATCGSTLSTEGLCLPCALSGTVADTPPPSSRTFAGHELLEEIGQDGAMGSVFKAREIHSGRIVALKMLRSERLRSHELVRRFQLEVETAAKLSHPNLLPIFNVGENLGQLYYTMMLATGGSLARQLADHLWDIPRSHPKAALQAQHRIARLLKAVSEAVHHAPPRNSIRSFTATSSSSASSASRRTPRAATPPPPTSPPTSAGSWTPNPSAPAPRRPPNDCSSGGDATQSSPRS